MSLRIGLVGLPNVGKSTIFNALTGANAAVASYPFTTIEPNVGVAAVPDQRLNHIAALVQPQRVVPATVEFVDIAGLIKGSSRGEGLGNQFLSHIHNVDAVSMIVRCFRAPQVPHVTAELDPAEDIAVVNLELALADLASLERRLERVQQMAKGQHEKDLDLELELLEKVRASLARGELVRRMDLEPEEQEMLRPLTLLTSKPTLYVANVGEDELPTGGELAAKVAQIAGREGAQFVPLCARLEVELATWPAEEAAAYRAELGVNESGIECFVRAGYWLLDLVTFFTTTGGKEVRAWTLPCGSTALEAAGHIHSDLERGFIRAEVMSYQDLATFGSFEAVREKGGLRVEGRDYLVQDGDIIHIRFSV